MKTIPFIYCNITIISNSALNNFYRDIEEDENVDKKPILNKKTIDNKILKNFSHNETKPIKPPKELDDFKKTSQI